MTVPSAGDADDHTTSYEYDLLGRLLQTTGPDPDGSGPLSAAVSTTSYDLADDLTTTTDPLGNATETFTDGNNRVTTVVNPDGTTSTNQYDAVGNLIASTDSRGATTEYFYDAENRLIFTLLPDGATVSTAYNADGQVESSTDANGNTTTNAYDANGRLTSRTNPAGQTTSFTYDAMGNVATQTDPTGTTTFTRDLLGRITQTRAPGDVITTTDYDPDGNITNQTVYDVSGLSTIPDDPRTLSSDRKRSTTTAYDVLDRPVEVTDPADNHSYTTYDAAGLVTSTTDAAGATTTDAYDDAGRLITQTGPDPDGTGPETTPVTQFTYDADNNLISETDPLSQTTTSAYNDMNELVSVTQPDPDGSGSETAPVTNYTYDTDGRQVSIADADGNTTFTTYDSVGRQLTKVNALGAKWTYSYDPSGNLISTTDADGRTTEYTYNNLNQVTAEKWMDSDGVTVLRTIAYTYNDKNQLETVSDPDSSYAYTYDDAGRVLTIDNDGTPDLPDVTLTQTYDGVGNLASLDANVAGTDLFTNSYTYDSLGEMTKVTQSGSGVSDKGTTFAYNPLGQFTSVATFASTTSSDPIAGSSYGYDDANRLTSLTQSKSSDSSTIAAYGFTYDANGQLTAETNPDGSIAYTYDHDGRLTGASGTGLPASQDYAYDSNNNRTSTTVGSTTNSSLATSGNNQLSTDGTYNYAYDADGNLITKTTISTGATENFAWDYRNRLTDVTYKNSEGTTTQHIHYTYDVFNNRIGQEIDSTGSGTYDQVEHYVYSGGNLLMTLNGSGAVTHVFLNGPASNQVLADDAGSGNVTWMLADQQGSVRDVLDSTGAPIDHIQYDPYGNILTQSSPTDQPRFLYVGIQLDSTGLYFDNARYYDPSTGSFISTDPSGFAGGSANLYGYVNADPANLVDPSGLSPKGNGGDGSSGPGSGGDANGAGGGASAGGGLGDGGFAALAAMFGDAGDSPRAMAISGLHSLANQLAQWGDQTAANGSVFDGTVLNFASGLSNAAAGILDLPNSLYNLAQAGGEAGARITAETGSEFDGDVVAFAYTAGSVFGLTQLAQAATGENFVTGNDLSANERWTLGFAGTSALAFSGAAGVEGAEPAAAESTGWGLARANIISRETATDLLTENGLTEEKAASFLDQIDGPITARIVEPGESFLRYTDNAESKGSFLTTTRFAAPPAAVDGLNLGPWGNNATLVQPVSATSRSIVLEGGIAGGAPGVRQTIIVDRNAFEFGTGKGY